MKYSTLLFFFFYIGVQAQIIKINEVVSSNSEYTDEDGDTPDWFELHNPGSEDVSIDGWFISDDLDELSKTLEEHPSIGTIKSEGIHLIAYLKEPLSGSDLNKLLNEKGIYLSYLVHRKESLEEQFLELTKTK